MALRPARSPSALQRRELSSPVRRDWSAVLHPLHSGERGHACLADQLDALSHNCCHKRGLGFLQDCSERESDSIGTSAALLTSVSCHLTLDELQPQGKAGPAAHSALSRCTGQQEGSPQPYIAKTALDRQNATISPGRKPCNPSLLNEQGLDQQTNTDPVQICLDLALHTPDFQGNTGSWPQVCILKFFPRTTHCCSTQC